MQRFNQLAKKLCGKPFGPIMNKYVRVVNENKDFLTDGDKKTWGVSKLMSYYCWYGINYGSVNLESINTTDTYKMIIENHDICDLSETTKEKINDLVKLSASNVSAINIPIKISNCILAQDLELFHKMKFSMDPNDENDRSRLGMYENIIGSVDEIKPIEDYDVVDLKVNNIIHKNITQNYIVECYKKGLLDLDLYEKSSSILFEMMETDKS